MTEPKKIKDGSENQEPLVAPRPLTQSARIAESALGIVERLKEMGEKDPEFLI